MKRWGPWVMWWSGVLVLLAWGALGTWEANRRDLEQTQNILSMQAQLIANHVNAWKPEYSAHLQRVVSSNPRHLRVLLYDLSGWEIGRPGGSGAALPLNQTAARLPSVQLLRPMNGETPLPGFATLPPEVAADPRVFNRLFASNILGAAWVQRMVSHDGEPWVVATAAVNDYDVGSKTAFISAWLQACMRQADVLRPLNERWFRFGTLVVGVAALLGSWTWWTTRHSRSLNAVADTAERLPIDRLHGARLEVPEDNREAARLVAACNRLIERVGEVHLAQQRFVADAAHELRTPLTILRGEIQVALREPANHPLLVQTLRSNLEESVHLSRLVDSLLTLARSDAGQPLAPRQRVDLSALIKQVLDKLDIFAAGRQVRLSFVPAVKGEGMHVEADPLALERIVFNLVENAVKHSPPQYEVVVTLAATSSGVCLSVTDQGIGIEAEHLPHLFERFYRVDSARRRADGGTGLGLSLVKALTESHGGKVGVRSEIGVGSTFTVEFPLAQASS